jgi:uncharacterized protein (DUF433 family)
MLEPSDGTSVESAAAGLLWTDYERTTENSLFAGDFYARGRNLSRILRLLIPVPATAHKDIESTRGDLGTGVYGLSDLRHLLAISDAGERPKSDLLVVPHHGRRQREPRWGDAAYWLRTALNPVPHTRWRADYSFSDLISLLVARELMLKGVLLHKVKDAEAWMRNDLSIDRPFVREDIETDGVEVFYLKGKIAGQVEAASLRGQQALVEPIKDRLKSVSYSGGRATRWTPARGVVVDPRVQFGAPTVEGTGIPTEAVAGVASTLGTTEAARRFELSPGAVRQAINFEQRVASLN